MISRRVGTGVVIGAIALAGLAGCSAEDIAENAVDKASGGDVDLDIGDLPDGFPKDDVPVPKGDILSGVSLGSGTEETWTVIFEVGDLSGAAASYRDKLSGAGYKITDTFSTEDSSGSGEVVSYTATGPKYLVNVFGGGGGSEDALTVVVSPALAEVP